MQFKIQSQQARKEDGRKKIMLGGLFIKAELDHSYPNSKRYDNPMVSFYTNFSTKRQNLPINLSSSGRGIFAIIATSSHSDNGTFL